MSVLCCSQGKYSIIEIGQQNQNFANHTKKIIKLLHGTQKYEHLNSQRQKYAIYKSHMYDISTSCLFSKAKNI